MLGMDYAAVGGIIHSQHKYMCEAPQALRGSSKEEDGRGIMPNYGLDNSQKLEYYTPHGQ
jgi:hypothetical protein